MSSPDLQTAVIACPHCGTRYQVPRATLGAGGRDVQCAHCSLSWHATAETSEPDEIFSEVDESRLDEVFEAEARSTSSARLPIDRDPEHERTLAEIRAAIAPRARPRQEAEAGPATAPAPAGMTAAFDKRLEAMRRSLPFSRLRRGARLLAFSCLGVVLLAGFFGREWVVGTFPAPAGPYAAIGLGVNLVGLEFGEARTLTSLKDGRTVMQVSAMILSVSPRTVPVPQVIITLLDENEAVLFEWLVTPKAREMGAGDVLEFSAEVSSPPEGAKRVRLSFSSVRGDAAKKVS